MADKISFKLETGLKIFIDKNIRNEFEDVVRDKIKVSIDKNWEAEVSIDEKDFLFGIIHVNGTLYAKWGTKIVSEKNWEMLKAYPKKVVIHRCSGSNHAKNFYCLVLEKYVDFVACVDSEGYLI